MQPLRSNPSSCTGPQSKSSIGKSSPRLYNTITRSRALKARRRETMRVASASRIGGSRHQNDLGVTPRFGYGQGSSGRRKPLTSCACCCCAVAPRAAHRSTKPGAAFSPPSSAASRSAAVSERTPGWCEGSGAGRPPRLEANAGRLRCLQRSAAPLPAQRTLPHSQARRRLDTGMRDEHDAALRPRTASSVRNAQCAGHIAKR